MDETNKGAIQFVKWTKVKIRIHFSKKEIYFREGEIWWASLGINVGHEEEGKNDSFERPVLVLKKFNEHTLWTIPLTSQIKEDNIYYYEYCLGSKKYSAILTQLRLISSKRLLRKIDMFPLKDYQNIKEKIKSLL